MRINLCIEFRYSIIVIGTVISFLFINTQNIILSMEVFVKSPYALSCINNKTFGSSENVQRGVVWAILRNFGY